MFFWFKIHPKPRGNFRPLVEVKWEIRVMDYPHRPYLPNIKIISSISEETCNCKGKGIILSQAVKEIEEPPLFYKTKLRGGNDNIMGLNCSKSDCSCCELYREGYLDANVLIQKQFYLPWKRGKTPDYSDYFDAFKKIPLVIEKLLQDGLNSGESREMEYNYSPLIKVKEEVKDGIKPIRIVTR